MAIQQKRGPAPIVGVMQQKVFGLPVDLAVIFSNYKNAYKKRIEKRQRWFIVRLSFLKPFLELDEKILQVTTGHSPTTIFEKMGLGWFFVYLKRSLLVFTDRRIFHVPTTPAYRYRNSITQIPYRLCRSISMKGRNLILVYKASGVTETFFSLAGREKKKIGEILKSVPVSNNGAAAGGRTHLCPRCAAPLTASGYACRRCHLRFKTGTLATLMAVLLPGGGYFYIRQPFLGAMSAILEISLLAMVGTAYSNLVHGDKPFLLAGAATLFILEKIAVAIHAGVFIKEFVPRKKKFDFQSVSDQTG
ncbi:MAG: hypothetical protein WBR24_14530 [Desulfobacterales bacterium]